MATIGASSRACTFAGTRKQMLHKGHMITRRRHNQEPIDAGVTKLDVVKLGAGNCTCRVPLKWGAVPRPRDLGISGFGCPFAEAISRARQEDRGGDDAVASSLPTPAARSSDIHLQLHGR